MAKRTKDKSTNNDLQNTTQKTKDEPLEQIAKETQLEEVRLVNKWCSGLRDD
jgi:hypothetical protein